LLIFEHTRVEPTNLRGSYTSVSDRRTLQSKSSLTICFRIRHLGVGVYLSQILLVTLGRGLDGIVAGVPIRRAHLAVLVCELESVDQTERLVYAAADREIVDCDLEREVSVHVSFRLRGTRNIPVAQCQWGRSRTIRVAQYLPPRSRRRSPC
jgi:hypothetical protein